jgi:hypothetical protein
MKIRTAALAAAMLTTAAVGSAPAAEIRKDGSIVYITGQIVEGDYEKFVRTSGGMGRFGALFLNSPGGALGDGLSIAEATRQMGVMTGVPNNATCASMCAIIWLAGSPRLVASNAHIGFHAISYVKDGKVAGDGNAMVGAFLNKLGLSYTAIAFVTSAPPTAINWLNVTKARQLGIDTKVVPVPSK